jgi:hypothetical protein
LNSGAVANVALFVGVTGNIGSDYRDPVIGESLSDGQSDAAAGSRN